MIRRLIAFLFLSGIATIAGAASVSNFDSIDFSSPQNKPAASSENTENSKYLRPLSRLALLKNVSEIPAQQNYANLYLLLKADRIDASDFLNPKHGFKKNSITEENSEDFGNDNTKIWDDIKTSLKNVNTELNRLEDWANQILMLDSDTANLAKLSAQRINLPDEIKHSNRFVDPDSEELNLKGYKDNPDDDDLNFADQPLFSQILHLFSPPKLLEFFSNNIITLILLLLLWFAIKLSLKFFLWKVESRKIAKTKKNRGIDGIIHY